MAVGKEAAAARLSRRCVQVFPVLILWLPLAAAGFFTVEMAGKTQTVFLNDNATISCKVSGSRHLSRKTVGIIWFWKDPATETEVKVFEFFRDRYKAVRSGASVNLQRLEEGDASLQLPGVQLREAGEYRCELTVTPQKALGTVSLEVVASPRTHLFHDSDGKRILCMSSGFYPEDINITLSKWTQENPQPLEISDNITTGPAIKNEDGTFNVTSCLLLPGPLEHDVTFQCVVRHKSLPTSKKLNITLSGMGYEMGSGLWITIIGVCLVAVIVLIAVLLQKRCRHCKWTLRYTCVAQVTPAASVHSDISQGL